MWLKINLQQEYSSLVVFISVLLNWIGNTRSSSSLSQSSSSHRSDDHRLLPGRNLLTDLEPAFTDPPVKRNLSPEVLHNVESKLLEILGLQKRPRPDRAKVDVPDYMLQLYRDRMSLNGLTANLKKPIKSARNHLPIANTVRSFTHSEFPEDKRNIIVSRHSTAGNKEILVFNVTTIPSDEKIKGADLRMFISQKWAKDHFSTAESTPPSSFTANKSGSTRENLRFLIRIHEILSDPSEAISDDDIITRTIDSHLVDVTDSSRWISVDMHPLVERWSQDPQNNFGVQVEILSPDGREMWVEKNHGDSSEYHIINPIRTRRFRRAADPLQVSTEWTNKKNPPVMVVYSDDPRAPKPKTERGRKPNTRPQQQGHHRNRDPCRRQNLYVDFSDVGWNDWIVAPPGYQAFYCAGQCHFPLSDHLNVTNHALVQTLVNNVNKGAVPQVCCIPTELSPISLLYIDEHEKVVLKNYQDMVVEGCGCR